MLVKGEENFTGKKGRAQRNGGKKKQEIFPGEKEIWVIKKEGKRNGKKGKNKTGERKSGKDDG